MMSAREQELRNQAERALQSAATDDYRQHFHIQPPVGLLNDPNGLIEFQGEYHVFYQWNPFETAHGAKFWAHMTSTDLVHWQWHEPALVPSEWYEKNGCYSGSAVVVGDELWLYYTGNVKGENNERFTYQCLAVSADGRTFHKEGPVLNLPDGYTPHFRDPKVWLEDETFYMVIGAQNEQETGRAPVFTSTDGRSFEQLGEVSESGTESLGAFGYMWECPDLFSLNDTDVLLFSPQGLEADGTKYQNVFQAGYVAGTWDQTTGRLHHGAFHELDEGFEFYAPQTFTDRYGRRLMFGWMGVPEQYEKSQPTVTNGWVHCLTLPRVLTYSGGRIYQQPAEELKKLRQDQQHFVTTGEGLEIHAGSAYEFEFEPKQDSRWSLMFGDGALLEWDPVKRRLICTRTNWETGEEEKRVAEISTMEKLQGFVDASSIELFINNGEKVMTARIFPNHRAFRYEGKAGNQLTLYPFAALDE
ncbi:beta-fructofuranosidase [Salsuginibacillus halophilus]|uniref:Sucrose-6-phosphate hydrolase n=1 Tax=Salsuginibacillus halophilus TaxID=517424 RepID=A0A2P8HE90_9BACI|nr:sucrose-6-phosphate hydrolase [Salsuginibacillus halophilus]PSL44532.1 beta-fructofuranosidase [Salsuginibacillus halophilus]